MTGIATIPRRRPAPADLVRTEADLAALTAESPTAVVDSALGLLQVRREEIGPFELYTVGLVGSLTPTQAAALCRLVGAHLPDWPDC